MKSLLIGWNEWHELGIPIIDEQHRAIIAEINSLFYILDMRENHEILANILEVIRLESCVHFAVEEDLMKQYSYPDFLTHKAEHTQLSSHLSDITILDEIITNPNKFLNYLKAWWIDHISQEDRTFADFLRNSGQYHPSRE